MMEIEGKKIIIYNNKEEGEKKEEDIIIRLFFFSNKIGIDSKLEDIIVIVAITTVEYASSSMFNALL